MWGKERHLKDYVLRSIHYSDYVHTISRYLFFHSMLEKCIFEERASLPHTIPENGGMNHIYDLCTIREPTISQMPKKVEKGNPSSLPDWHTASIGGPQYSADDNERASQQWEAPSATKSPNLAQNAHLYTQYIFGLSVSIALAHLEMASKEELGRYFLTSSTLKGHKTIQRHRLCPAFHQGGDDQ